MSSWIVLVIAAVGIALQILFILQEKNKKYVAADIFKGLASLMFVIIGIIGYNALKPDSWACKILAGLIFGMIGDIVMNLRFVLKDDAGQKAFLGGILAFLIGHVLYLCALIPIANNLVIDIIIGAVLAAALLIYIFKTMEVKTAFKIFGIFYLGAIIIMTVMAIDIAVSTAYMPYIVYAVGAVLFMASDIVLIFNTFSGKTVFSKRVLNLSLYYVGQLLIAGCMLIG